MTGEQERAAGMFRKAGWLVTDVRRPVDYVEYFCSADPDTQGAPWPWYGAIRELEWRVTPCVKLSQRGEVDQFGGWDELDRLQAVLLGIGIMEEAR